MRLSFILSSLWLSGGIRVIVEYANRLAERGHHVTLVAPGDTLDQDILRELSSSVAVRESVVPRTPELESRAVVPLAISLAKTVPPSDVIISTHTPTTVVGFIAAHLLRRGRPVWLCQDYCEMFIGRPIETWLFRNALRWHTLALVVSEYSRKELQGYYSGDVVVVGEGLSHADLFRPLATPRKTRRDRKNVLFLGDMRPRKGLFDFLQAAAIVYERVPDVKLQIVSKEECHVETHVPFEYIYRPSREELARLYATCDVFVSASWWESFGLPPLEAMACSAPVVLTNSGGVLEYARPDENCLMVPPREPELLAEAMVRVLTDEELGRRLAEKGPPTARQFDWESAVDRFEAALQQLLDTSR